MKRKTILSGLIIIFALIAGGIYFWQSQQAKTTATASVQTTTVKRGSLAATVSAAGNVSAPNSVAAAFESSTLEVSARVAKVNVKVGDTVKKGDVLMEVDTTNLNLALKTAQSNLASAQVSYDQTKNDLNFALRTAQASFDSAKTALAAAQANNAQNPNNLVVAKANLDTATITMQKAQADYDTIAWRGDVGMTTQAATLQTATIAYQSALASYKIAAAKINDSDLKSAQATYTNAQVALEQAQKNLETKLATAQATLDNAKLNVEQAQRALDNAKLVAPYDGVVSAVNYGIGDNANGTAVTIVDLSLLQVKVTVAEVDIAKIKIGQTATMTLDALTGKTYNAKVIAVSPVGSVTSGVVNYTVTLEITNSDGSIKPSMTANLTLEVERRDNVLLIPTRAVTTKGNQKVVTVKQKDQTVTKVVTVGLSNDSFVEIVDGLQGGDVVIVNTTTTKSTNTGGGGMGIPGIGGGGPPAGP
ncbi:MAG: efflux RND transporter periplasmic adaptor subunit [Chloroflexota bacterium]